MSPLHYGDHKLDLVSGRTVFDYADDLRVRVPTSCRRSGECHECIVQIVRGGEALTAATQAEKFLREGYRLACQAQVLDAGATIEFALLRRRPRILTQTVRRHAPVEPLTRLQGANVVFDGSTIDTYRGGIYGLAVDLGTTTIALNLVDLENGAVLHTASFENPQRFGGSDIMRRISYDGGRYRGELHNSVISGLNYEIRELSRMTGVPRRQIYEVVIVGNAAMRDLCFGLDIQSIGEKPYQSVTQLEMERGERPDTVLNYQARALGLRVHPAANVYGGPLIGCHVGADVAADLLAVGMDEEEDVVMLVDVGTNTEVVVGNRHGMMAASCPAGPAFEGGEITFGMPGYEGAIESVELRNGEVIWRTIGGAAAEGICGSGLIDLLAELLRVEDMNYLGVLAGGLDRFTLPGERGIFLSRADISALAQAKAANYSGQWIVLRKYGISPVQLKRLYLAGGFANYVNVDNAMSIGFIPPLPQGRVAKVGNSALEGATLILTSRTLRRRLEEMVRRIEHIELETTEDFFDIFVEGCLFQSMPAQLDSDP
ncbi:MAG: ASKHA domain-containing protein, partial [Candidatus Aminicenantes bacterium]|nr:ASKHA domain-containing protein [Candidatus Aminicenantes bacterium]